MSSNRHLAPGVDNTLSKTQFSLVTDAVGALIFPVKSNKFPPNINLVRSFSSFSGFNSQTIYPYVTFLSLGTLDLGINMTTFFLLISLIPWANCPNSFEKYLYQNFLSGPLIRCLYYWATPEMSWVTEFAARFFGIVMSMHTLAGDFYCLLISNGNWAVPCTHLEVAQCSPLVVG